MGEEIKTSINIDKELWKRFKLKATAERGLKGLSNAVEEALEEELSELLVVKTLESMLPVRSAVEEVVPVKPMAKTSAEEAIRELRDSRIKVSASEPLLKFAFTCPNCRRQFILSEMIERFCDKTEVKCIECGEPIKAIDLFQSIRRIIGN